MSLANTTPIDVKEMSVPVRVHGLTVDIYYQDIHSIIEQYYDGCLQSGIKPEIARYVLTNATHTKLHVAANLEALMRLGISLLFFSTTRNAGISVGD